MGFVFPPAGRHRPECPFGVGPRTVPTDLGQTVEGMGGSQQQAGTIVEVVDGLPPASTVLREASRSSMVVCGGSTGRFRTRSEKARRMSSASDRGAMAMRVWATPARSSRREAARSASMHPREGASTQPLTSGARWSAVGAAFNPAQPRPKATAKASPMGTRGEGGGVQVFMGHRPHATELAALRRARSRRWVFGDGGWSTTARWAQAATPVSNPLRPPLEQPLGSIWAHRWGGAGSSQPVGPRSGGHTRFGMSRPPRLCRHAAKSRGFGARGLNLADRLQVF